MYNAFKSRLFRLIAAIICTFLLCAVPLIVSGMIDDVHTADVAIVLGNTVNQDGSPSHRLAARLDTAVELYRRGIFQNVIVSGGIGRERFNEAEIMKSYLVKRGVPEAKIIADSFGVTTAATATNAATIAKEHHWSSVLVISQYFHIQRCRLALSRVGFDQVYSAHARYFEPRDIYSIFREEIGYAAYLVGAHN